MRVTSHDVARLAKVSQPTVSRALRGDSRVAEPTRLRVVEAATALGYVPSEVGRSLSTSATRQVAMLADLENPLYPRLIGPLHDSLRSRGYRMVVLAERGDGDNTPDRLLDRSIDGAVLTTSLVKSPLPFILAQRGLPFVQLNRVSDLVDADSVTADNYAGGQLVADLLVKLGHRKVAAILGPAEASTSRDRERGMVERLSKAGVALPTDMTFRTDFSYDEGFAGFVELISREPRPTAVACINDVVAVGALNAAISKGLEVPRDVTLVGFDNLEVARWPCFQITTVHVDLDAMAVRAAELLIDRLLGKQTGPPMHITFDVSLVERQTHASPPA